MVRWLVGAVVALGIVFVVVVASQPSELRVVRSATVHGPPMQVYALIDDFASFREWSPWEDKDPDMTVTFEGPKDGVGAIYRWKGNDQVGEGRMEILEADQGERVLWDLHFLTPWEARNQVEITVAPEGEDTRVTWTMTGTNDFLGKAFGLFLDMDAMIGPDFERGLAKMDVLAQAREEQAMKAFEEMARSAEGGVFQQLGAPADGGGD